jgi:hypothetical protein
MHHVTCTAACCALHDACIQSWVTLILVAKFNEGIESDAASAQDDMLVLIHQQRSRSTNTAIIAGTSSTLF